MHLHSYAERHLEVPPDQQKWPLHRGFSSIEEIIEEARAGRCFVLVDDHADIAVADVVIPAQFASSDVLGWMYRTIRGLVRLALPAGRINYFRLQTMAKSETCDLSSQFTLSIKSNSADMTGVLSWDRERTIAVAIDPTSTPTNLSTPGHLFALVTAEDGVLENAGRGEAAVDIADIAGLNASAVICEAMGATDPLQSIPEFRNFARQHDMKIAFISDLVSYRLRYGRHKYLADRSGSKNHPRVTRTRSRR